jgi:predicted enzyme related to lactoylglutathione lyase
MPTRDSPWPHGTPCWVDLGLDDVGTGRLFYEGLFGWSMAEPPPEFGGYIMCLKDGRPAAGLGPKVSPDQPTQWITYIAVDSVDDVAARVSAAGGQVLAPPMDVMDAGRVALAADPAGALFGIWQAGTHNGAGVYNEPGSLIWSENFSSDWGPNKIFYAAVFGWEYNDMSGPGFNYATFRVDGRDVGGIGELPEDGPAEPSAYWNTYFAVDDTDAATDQVVRLGGDVLRPPSDSPYGRMSSVSDSQGARFSMMSAPAEGYEADGGQGADS